MECVIVYLSLKANFRVALKLRSEFYPRSSNVMQLRHCLYCQLCEDVKKNEFRQIGREVWNETNLLILLGELRREEKEHGERNDVKWNRLNEELYVRLLDVNAKRRKENRIYVFILSFNYLQCALRHSHFRIFCKLCCLSNSRCHMRMPANDRPNI